MLFIPCIFLQLLHQPNHALNKIHSWAIIKKKAYMFQYRGDIISGPLNTKEYTGYTQKNGAVLIVFTIKTAPFFCVCPVDPTHQSSYYFAFTEVIKIWNTKILKYVKFIIINLKCNINSIKGIKIKRSRCCSCLQLYESCMQTSVSIVCRDLVLV
jgi:hypothetical protein